jgi:hypothetical protein
MRFHGRVPSVLRVGWVGALVAVLVAALAPPSAVAQGARLPQRNLLVELRWTEARERSAGDASLRGGTRVGTAGRVDAQGSVVLRSARGDDRAEAAQRITVLNGQGAGLRTGASVPLQWLELAVTPKGPVAVLRQAWTEVGGSIEVRPRWPGGRAPVTVQVSRTSSDVSSDVGAASAPRSEEAFTTLQLPLDEWVTVARSAEAAAGPVDGAISSRDAGRRAHRLLQMRVSVP